MTLLLALFRKELVYKPREKWFHAKRLLFIAVGAIIVLGVYIQQMQAEETKAGLVMFQALSMLVIVSSCLVGPYMACSAIVSEKETRTLSLLMISDISTWQLLFSKLMSAIATTFFTVVSVLPLFILCVSLGGITYYQVIMAFPILLTTVLSGTCLGLLVSCFIDRELRMQGYVAIASILYFAGLPALIFLIANMTSTSQQAARVLVVICPAAATNAIAHAQNFDLIGWNCLFNSLIGLPMIPLTMILLPRLLCRPDVLGAMALRTYERAFGRSYHQLRKRRPSILGNPVTWKDLHIHYGGELGSWVRCVLLCIFSGLIVGGIYLFVCLFTQMGIKFSMVDLISLALGAVTLVSGISYLYGAISRAAQCLSREKKTNSLEILLTTDISSYSIIMGKSNAISLVQLPWIIAFICSSIGFLLYSAIARDLEGKALIIIAALALNLLCMVFAYEYLSLYMSLKLRNYTTATALAGFVAWYVVGNLLLGIAAAIFAPFTIWLSVIAFPVGGPVIIGNHFRLRLIDEFHRLATKGSRPHTE